MSAQIHAFLCLQDNIGVLIHDPNTGACAAIDAPDEGAILAALSEKGWQLTDILVTHRHGDHVQGIDGLKRRTGCRVVAPVKAREAVPHADAYVREGDTVHVGGMQAHVW
ncbi:MAG: hydroxyacylglutathione hydrolase, partial [Microvirga sp.]|nr:hydroxyacylglutathione hydrolase [Microvirga sp.]